MKKPWFGIVFLLIGIAIGWSVHGRSQGGRLGQHNPFTVTFEPGHELRILPQPSISGDELHLVPFAVSSGGHRTKVGESPTDPKDLWLVTYDGVIVSCRSKQSPSQQP